MSDIDLGERRPTTLASECERVLRAYRASGSTAKSVQSYRETVNRLVAHMRGELGREPLIDDLTLDEVEDYLASCRDEVDAGRLANESYRSHARRLRALSGRMHARGQIDAHRLLALRTPRRVDAAGVPAVPRPEDVLRVLASCDLTTRAGRLQAALVALIADSGIRRSELEAADIMDVDLERNLVHVRRPAKNGRTRWVAFGEVARRYLLAFLRTRTMGPLFLTTGGRRLQARAILQHISDAGKRAGLDQPLGPQRLRRFAATRLCTQGINQPLLYALMGWTEDRRRVVTTAYVDLEPTAISRAFVTLSPVDNLAW